MGSGSDAGSGVGIGVRVCACVAGLVERSCFDYRVMHLKVALMPRVATEARVATTLLAQLAAHADLCRLLQLVAFGMHCVCDLQALLHQVVHTLVAGVHTSRGVQGGERRGGGGASVEDAALEGKDELRASGVHGSVRRLELRSVLLQRRVHHPKELECLRVPAVEDACT